MPTVSPEQSSPGEEITAAKINNPVNTLAAAINGQLDDNNIASVSGTKITTATLDGDSFDATLRQGWLASILAAPNTITYNGNRSYSVVFNSVDYSDRLSPGMRLKLTRSVAAPTQVTALSGTKYWSKASPNKFSWTDDFTIDVVISPTSYALGTIVSTYNGTSGWALRMNASGQIQLVGYNAGAANFSQILSYQSVALNKETRITGQLDMSAFTNTATTSYIMFDGVDVPAAVSRGGTNPTALVQAGNLNVGAENGGTNPFQGNISQLAIFNAKVTQATIRTYHGQAYSGSETSVASAYSFNGVATDLNTTTPNDLTANNSAAYATGGTFGKNGVSTTIEYGIVTAVSFSTNTTVTVQVPEGCALPVSGGVSAVAYSPWKAPYGLPISPNKWRVSSWHKTSDSVTSNATYGSFQSGGWQLIVPVGEWDVGFQSDTYNVTATVVHFALSSTALTGLSNTAGSNVTAIIARVVSTTTAAIASKSYVEQPQSLTVPGTYVMYTLGATTSAGTDGTVVPNEIFAEFALL